MPSKSCPGSAGNDSRARDTLLNANGVALERVNGQPERREVADAERRRRRIEHLTDDRGALDDRARDRRPQHERRRGGTVAVVRWRLDAECGDGGAGRPECGARFAGRRFRFLNLSERHDLLCGQAALALERSLGQRESRTGGEVLGALAPQLGTGQFRKRLAAAHRVARH